MNKYDAYFLKWGNHYKVPPSLLKAIAKKESDFRPHALGDYVNDKPTSFGLMQVNKKTYDSIKLPTHDITHLLIPDINIMYGAKILKGKIDVYKTIPKGIIGYNGHYGKPTTGGLDYLRDVLTNQAMYKKDFTNTMTLLIPGIILLLYLIKKHLK